jgi:hypothetical protein
VRKALATLLSIWSLHVVLLSKVTPRYLTLFTKGMSRPFNCNTSSGTLDRPSFPLINLYVCPVDPVHIMLARTCKRHCLQRLLHCCAFIRCCGHVFTALSPSSGHMYSFHHSGFQPPCRNRIKKKVFNNSIQFFIIYVPSQQLQGQLQTQHIVYKQTQL